MFLCRYRNAKILFNSLLNHVTTSNTTKSNATFHWAIQQQKGEIYDNFMLFVVVFLLAPLTSM